MIQQRRSVPHATVVLAQSEWMEAEYEDAIERLLGYLRSWPDDLATRLGAGMYLIERGRYREAIVQFERALKIDPGNLPAEAGIAEALEMKGDADRARRRLMPFLRSGRETAAMARIAARLEAREGHTDEVLSLVARHVDQAATSPFLRRQLYFIGAAALERAGRYAEAFVMYGQANRVERPAWDPQEEERMVERTAELLSRERLASVRKPDLDATGIVFVVGRPRSGSTLVERIIASHPNAVAAGEVPALVKVVAEMASLIGSEHSYPDCLQDLTESHLPMLGQAYIDRIRRGRRKGCVLTDKHLYTWRFLGLIEWMLPGARIIDLRRDAADNCFSCYASPLGPRFPFSYDLEHLGRSHRAYERMMEHWHNVMTVPILRVRYEDIVADQEGESRRIVEFCGLPWNDACMAFHKDSRGTAGSVPAAPTLSYDQVRRPIFDSSIGRAARFGALVDPLMRALAR